jgi:hypothetical protein
MSSARKGEAPREARREIDTMTDVRVAPPVDLSSPEEVDARAAALDGLVTSETSSTRITSTSFGARTRRVTRAASRWVSARGNQPVTKTSDAGTSPDASRESFYGTCPTPRVLRGWIRDRARARIEDRTDAHRPTPARVSRRPRRNRREVGATRDRRRWSRPKPGGRPSASPEPRAQARGARRTSSRRMKRVVASAAPPGERDGRQR